MADQYFLWNSFCVVAFVICVLLQAPFYWPIQRMRKFYKDDSETTTWNCGRILRAAYFNIIRCFLVALLEAFLLLKLPPIALFSLLVSAKVLIVIAQDVLEYTYPPRIFTQITRLRLLISLTFFSFVWFLPILQFKIPEPRQFGDLLSDQMPILYCCSCLIGSYLLRRSAFSTRQNDRFEAYVRESVVYLVCPALLFNVNCACSYALSNGLYHAYNVWRQQDAISRNKSYRSDCIFASVILAFQMLLKYTSSNLKSCNIISQNKYMKRPSTETVGPSELSDSVSIPVCDISLNPEGAECDENDNSTETIRERYTQHCDLPSVVSQKAHAELASVDATKSTIPARTKSTDNFKLQNVDISTIKSMISDSMNMQLLPNPIRYVALSLIESLFLIFTCLGILDGTLNMTDESRFHYWILTAISLCGLGGLLSRSMLLPVVQSSGLRSLNAALDTITGNEKNTHPCGKIETQPVLKIISTDDAYMSNLELENPESQQFPLKEHGTYTEAFPLSDSGSVVPSPSSEKLWKTALKSVRTNDPNGAGLTRILSDLSDEDESEVHSRVHKDDTNSQNLKLFDPNAASGVIQMDEQTHTPSLQHYYFRRFERNKTEKKAWADPFADLDNTANHI